MKFEAARIHFSVTFSSPSPSLSLLRKLPNGGHQTYQPFGLQDLHTSRGTRAMWENAGKFRKYISPGASILKGCFSGSYIRREICASKSIGLAYSWKEIYVSNLQNVFNATRLEDVDLSKTHPCKCFVYIDRGNPSQEWRLNYANSNTLWHFLTTIFIGTILWQMQKFMCYCTVFALFYFEFEGF